MMQQGQSVSDILYITPEGAPMVFTPPSDALEDNGKIPDKKGYGFDACSPKMFLERADVKDGKVVFPGASSYEVMVLPNFKTMTPALLEKITSLVKSGAKIIGTPPLKSPSLVDYPNCDNQVLAMAEELWGTLESPQNLEQRKFGEGMIFWGGNLHNAETLGALYPDYESTVEILSLIGIHQDFNSKNNSIRYGHRKTTNKDIYFIANRTDTFQTTECNFRASGNPEIWITATGESRKIADYTVKNGITSIPMEFFPYESFFIVFVENKSSNSTTEKSEPNFLNLKEIKTLEGEWEVSFNPKMGGPKSIIFSILQDWTTHETRGIKYYSGIATYRKTFRVSNLVNQSYFIDLGVVHDIASVKLNGKDIGVVWCAPWRIDISEALNEGENELEIEVANRWINRLLGDQQKPDANVRFVKFENGLMGGKEFTTGRYTFTTEEAMKSFKFTEPLPSGLLGPVTIHEVIE